MALERYIGVEDDELKDFIEENGGKAGCLEYFRKRGPAKLSDGIPPQEIHTLERALALPEGHAIHRTSHVDDLQSLTGPTPTAVGLNTNGELVEAMIDIIRSWDMEILFEKLGLAYDPNEFRVVVSPNIRELFSFTITENPNDPDLVHLDIQAKNLPSYALFDLKDGAVLRESTYRLDEFFISKLPSARKAATNILEMVRATDAFSKDVALQIEGLAGSAKFGHMTQARVLGPRTHCDFQLPEGEGYDELRTFGTTTSAGIILPVASKGMDMAEYNARSDGDYNAGRYDSAGTLAQRFEKQGQKFALCMPKQWANGGSYLSMPGSHATAYSSKFVEELDKISNWAYSNVMAHLPSELVHSALDHGHTHQIQTALSNGGIAVIRGFNLSPNAKVRVTCDGRRTLVEEL